MGGGSDGGAVVDVKNGLCSRERVPLLVPPLVVVVAAAAAAAEEAVLLLAPAPKVAVEEGEAAVEVGK